MISFVGYAFFQIKTTKEIVFLIPQNDFLETICISTQLSYLWPLLDISLENKIFTQCWFTHQIPIIVLGNIK